MRVYLFRVVTGEQKGWISDILRVFLFAASVVYGGMVKSILFGYSLGLLRKGKLSIPVISVGNVTWGGVGKTPLVLWMVRYLRGRNVRPAVLTRGYSLSWKSVSSDNLSDFPSFRKLYNFLKDAVCKFSVNSELSGVFRAQTVSRHGGKNSHDNTPESSSWKKNLHTALKGKKEPPASPSDSDEVQLFLRSFPDIPVLVGANRLKNARQFLTSASADGFILDDGFQHWRIHRDLDIVAIDSLNPWGDGFLIPRGILREPLSSLPRADVFVLTKADRGKNNLSAIKLKLRDVNPKALIVEALHRAVGMEDLLEGGHPIPLSFLKGKKTGAFCGIGDPDSFFEMLSFLQADVVFKKKFLDHHQYLRQDILNVLAEVKRQKVLALVTTEKDAAKLKPFLNLFGRECRLFILKIDIEITQGEKDFCERISGLFIS